MDWWRGERLYARGKTELHKVYVEFVTEGEGTDSATAQPDEHSRMSEDGSGDSDPDMSDLEDALQRDWKAIGAAARRSDAEDSSADSDSPEDFGGEEELEQAAARALQPGADGAGDGSTDGVGSAPQPEAEGVGDGALDIPDPLGELDSGSWLPDWPTWVDWYASQRSLCDASSASFDNSDSGSDRAPASANDLWTNLIAGQLVADAKAISGDFSGGVIQIIAAQGLARVLVEPRFAHPSALTL